MKDISAGFLIGILYSWGIDLILTIDRLWMKYLFFVIASAIATIYFYKKERMNESIP